MAQQKLAFFDHPLMKAIIKSDISDHFTIAFIKSIFLKSLLHWLLVNFLKDVSQMYRTFLNTFLEIYETNFSYKQVTNE